MILSQIAFALGLRRAGENPDAFRGKHGVEGAGELARARARSSNRAHSRI